MTSPFHNFRVFISVQAQQGEPFAETRCKHAMIASVVAGGAQGLRLAGTEDIAWAHAQWPELPIIGITKPDPLPDHWREAPYITPTLADMQAIAQAGATVVAIDGTQRPRPDGLSLSQQIQHFRKDFPETLLMADVDSLTSALAAIGAGVDCVATTLAGYTLETVAQQLQATSAQPDWGLLYQLTQHCTVPVVLEGRIWQPADVTRAQRLGACSVVIGSAITRPWEITRHYLQAVALS